MSTHVVVDSVWFNNIGIVLVEDKASKERKAYIGNSGGFVQKEDERHIAEHGIPLPIEAVNMVSDFLRNARVGRVRG